ncbi:LacI family DNA-binding transcriptional regulator [Halanaerobium kushneri]|uniref:Transcriptional regulator, LacI family n=1 Tax=Halanaerobium kushneri TaxID=56779 RepID=A0A1N6SMC7_9FIRM|nr:LacI family DNA-binding transcriptional regulator [Halanaerobium kushneri]SIQ42106.1 transcriptional regulator, LacI family [Halanaerobium kushneri]
MAKVKLDDIAKSAGVSKATVSNALNNRKGVGEETKDKIIKIAKDLGYNKTKSSTSKSPKSIRIIIYKKHGYVVSDTPFFSNLLEGIQKECRDEGYEMMISHLSRNEKNYKEIINNISADSSSGYLILATEMLEEDLDYFDLLNKPVVLLDSFFKNRDYDQVVIDNYSASYKGTQRLIENGHKNIGYLHSSVYINNFYYRKLGFKDAIRESGLRINEDYQFSLEPTIEGSYQQMKEILFTQNPELPTSFFADNDIIAFGAVKALKEYGVKIPEEVSIIGFDDMPYCEICEPKMSTVKVHKQYLGEVAVKRLIEKIEYDDYVNQKIEISTELVERNSIKKVDI